MKVLVVRPFFWFFFSLPSYLFIPDLRREKKKARKGKKSKETKRREGRRSIEMETESHDPGPRGKWGVGNN